MKRVSRYGDSNTWGEAPTKSIDDVRRWGPDERWPLRSGRGARQRLDADQRGIAGTHDGS
jgi:hypothetical protein